jgi:hypothetical protein
VKIDLETISVMANSPANDARTTALFALLVYARKFSTGNCPDGMSYLEKQIIRLGNPY